VTDLTGTARELCSEEGEVRWRGEQGLWAAHREERLPIPLRRYLGDAANEEVYCELRYQGQLYDAETGLYYNRHRYYDAESGQYLSPDPIGLAGGIRPQGYVHNPLEFCDPFGLTPKEGSKSRDILKKARDGNYAISSEQRQKIIDSIDNPKLKSMFSELYRPGANVPDGGTAASILHTKNTGQLIGGSDHINKGESYLGALKNLVSGSGKYKNEALSGSDRSLANYMIDDLRGALGHL
ncbi:RHS repeat-associated core domain-containing protein, partial [Pectobacterium aroidearum]|uniref:RHS repeat-associated core domain-containing protein n=1 Tax=Pectobacterium aroidearum TaxID=1201031 RepID=UPI0027E476F8